MLGPLADFDQKQLTDSGALPGDGYVKIKIIEGYPIHFILSDLGINVRAALLVNRIIRNRNICQIGDIVELLQDGEEFSKPGFYPLLIFLGQGIDAFSKALIGGVIQQCNDLPGSNQSFKNAST